MIMATPAKTLSRHYNKFTFYLICDMKNKTQKHITFLYHAILHYGHTY